MVKNGKVNEGIEKEKEKYKRGEKNWLKEVSKKKRIN